MEIKTKHYQLSGTLKECVDPDTGRKFVLGQKITMPFHERWFANGATRYYDEENDMATATVTSMVRHRIADDWDWLVMINFKHLLRDPIEGEDIKSVPHKWAYTSNIFFSEEGAVFHD